ncbi:related to FES1 - Hsp70 nucleotide exchange factor [Melanopsichium pennsylvanicum]|uniref:Related to FES1 - Hsp70 nucleotide exchange factor n=2 Tax=Melanopsichium pennsylvanicum TaxID=63383 RepID=A0AAJ5C6E8_9BASI|nr:related to FES1-Hsp70 nucleotide exchange factor [Melanopsichium pennsylvanicum 4]SNX85772.1 related to FES1 - Hsp70 nucleotide exchange factor [Melanopsichium pennsylvanicum]
MSNDKNAQELLKWGLANSTAVTSAPSVEQISADIEAGRRPDLADPNLYDAIMGKSEAQMMREELAVAVDTTRTIQDRCTALDNFEMLIEQIDNANNITSLKMWQPIISLLSASEPEIQTAAAWIVGTAIQNNDKAQVAILEFQPVVALTDLLHSTDQGVRAKAMYALSGLLKHNPAAMDQFHKMDGWKTLRLALLDPSISLRRKTAFLINALLFQDPNSFDSSLETASSTIPSTATAVAPVASSRPIPAAAPVAPLETGPATLATNIPHPNVPRALLSSGILTTLISSLLPPGTDGVSDSDLPPPSGPDGDNDPRTDLDFSEKAATAILTFTSKLPSNNPTHFIDPNNIALLKALLHELQGNPLDHADGATTRWNQLGLDHESYNTFKAKVQAL